MKITLITLLPEMLEALHHGISGRAIKQNRITINTLNPRDFTEDVHHTVDDRPYGGGPGMVMKIEPAQKAIQQAKKTLPTAKVIHLSPQGTPLTQAAINKMAQAAELILFASRYEGVDERLIELEVDEEWSVGDYVVSGGELPAMLLIDAIIRQLPGALGHADSASQDSFADGLLDHPHYTRPEHYADKSVPKVLLSGDHKAIEQWRLQQSLLRTWQRRQDLLKMVSLTAEQQKLLAIIKEETQ